MLFIIFIRCSPLVAACASTGREGGLRSKSTLAYLEGGKVKTLIFFVYVICGCTLPYKIFLDAQQVTIRLFKNTMVTLTILVVH